MAKQLAEMKLGNERTSRNRSAHSGNNENPAKRRFFVGAAARLLAASLLGSASLSPAQAAQPIEHVITYGQSLAVGWNALPVISKVQPQNSLMFSSGVRTSYSVQDRPSLYTSLVPLVETAESSAGETPTAGTLQMINDLRFSENGVSYPNSPVRYLGSDPAYGGLTLAQLNYGSLPFYVVTENIWYGVKQAALLGVSYRLGAVTWTQGESDYTAGTTRQAYKAGMQTLHDWIDVYAKAFAGQSTSVPIIQHQVSSHLAFGAAYPRIALAQTDLANSSSGFYVATPSYFMDYGADGMHLTAASSKWLGAYYGLAYKRVVVDHSAWKPLQPVSATATGTSIAVKFQVPKPPLVLDTVQVTNPGNDGFSLVTATGVDLQIASIAVTGPDTVTIVARRPIPAGALLRYAFKGGAWSGRLTGPRGNLRDSQGDSLVFDPTGINRRMDNWCVIFERTVAIAG